MRRKFGQLPKAKAAVSSQASRLGFPQLKPLSMKLVDIYPVLWYTIDADNVKIKFCSAALICRSGRQINVTAANGVVVGSSPTIRETWCSSVGRAPKTVCHILTGRLIIFREGASSLGSCPRHPLSGIGDVRPLAIKCSSEAFPVEVSHF